MKVKDLIELLQELPEDMEVLISHHDGFERVFTHDFGAYNGTAEYVDFTDEFGYEYANYVSSLSIAQKYTDRFGIMYEKLPEEREVFILDC